MLHTYAHARTHTHHSSMCMFVLVLNFFSARRYSRYPRLSSLLTALHMYAMQFSIKKKIYSHVLPQFTQTTYGNPISIPVSSPTR